MRAPTGEQYEITRETAAGRARAVLTEVAAGIREYTVGDLDLTEPFPVGETPPLACGTVLVPWPNRVRDGLWSWRGEPQQLDLTEPAKRNAIHGLLRHTAYRVLEREAHAITQAATVFPRRGYPFLLDTSVRHELVEDGLTLTHTIRNVGDTEAPVAIGVHPYLRLGGTPVEDLALTVRAGTRLTSDERGNLTGEHPVEGTPYALRRARVGDLDLDDGFADLALERGRSAHTLEGADGRSLTLWGDESFAYLQVFTTRAFGPKGGALALALEPMTAPANALNTGRGLRILAPGEEWSASWGLRHEGLAG